LPAARSGSRGQADAGLLPTGTSGERGCPRRGSPQRLPGSPQACPSDSAEHRGAARMRNHACRETPLRAGVQRAERRPLRPYPIELPDAAGFSATVRATAPGKGARGEPSSTAVAAASLQRRSMPRVRTRFIKTYRYGGSEANRSSGALVPIDLNCLPVLVPALDFFKGSKAFASSPGMGVPSGRERGSSTKQTRWTFT
jgi:hypothetical protein